MAAYGDVRTGSRCVFLLYAYLVFVTKFRHRVFTDAHLTSMEEEIMRDVCADFETQLAEFNGENGHVHLLVAFPPTTTGPASYGRARTSPGASAAHRSRSCASTSSGLTQPVWPW